MLTRDRRRSVEPRSMTCAGTFWAHDPEAETFAFYSPIRPRDRYQMCPACYNAAREFGLDLRPDRREGLLTDANGDELERGAPD